jgi:hypothetical protein
MKKLLLLMHFFIYALLALFFSQNLYAHDWIKVKGNKFIDPQGKEIIFRGLCFSDPGKLARENHWDDNYFSEAKNWGANIVRFAIHPATVRDTGWDEYFKILDRGVDLAKKFGLYVIMDWHSIGNLKEDKYTNKGYITTKSETFRFWTAIAERYKNEPVVAMYELFNEPTIGGERGECSWPEWKILMHSLIDAIRVINPNALCLVAGFDWAYDLKQVKDDPFDRENIAYVSHPYPQKRNEPWPAKWDEDFGFVAKKYPLICTELGYALKDERGAHIPVISDDHYGEEITKYFDERGISFTIWCFDPQWAPMLFKDWNYTPTTQGRFFKNYLQRAAGIK